MMIIKNLKRKICFFSLLIIFVASCNKKIDFPIVDKKLAFQYVKEIAEIAPRDSGTKNNLIAAKLIAEIANKYGAKSKIDSWTAKTIEGNIKFNNVIATIQGESDDFILIGSHFDTKKFSFIQNFSGANDGASSSGLLLAIIKSINESKIKLEKTLKFVWFDGEECFTKYSDYDGLYGSKYYAKSIDKNKCKAAIILDMVGDKDLNITIPSNSTKFLVDSVFDIARKQGIEKYFNKGQGGIIDDHKPFYDLGIPAIDIIDFNYGPNNSYWHTDADTMDKISPESLEIIGNLTLQLIYSI